MIMLNYRMGGVCKVARRSPMQRAIDARRSPMQSAIDACDFVSIARCIENNDFNPTSYEIDYIIQSLELIDVYMRVWGDKHIPNIMEINYKNAKGRQRMREYYLLNFIELGMHFDVDKPMSINGISYLEYQIRNYGTSDILRVMISVSKNVDRALFTLLKHRGCRCCVHMSIFELMPQLTFDKFGIWNKHGKTAYAVADDTVRAKICARYGIAYSPWWTPQTHVFVDRRMHRAIFCIITCAGRAHFVPSEIYEKIFAFWVLCENHVKR